MAWEARTYPESDSRPDRREHFEHGVEDVDFSGVAVA